MTRLCARGSTQQQRPPPSSQQRRPFRPAPPTLPGGACRSATAVSSRGPPKRARRGRPSTRGSCRGRRRRRARPPRRCSQSRTGRAQRAAGPQSPKQREKCQLGRHYIRPQTHHRGCHGGIQVRGSKVNNRSRSLGSACRVRGFKWALSPLQGDKMAITLLQGRMGMCCYIIDVIRLCYLVFYMARHLLLSYMNILRHYSTYASYVITIRGSTVYIYYDIPIPKLFSRCFHAITASSPPKQPAQPIICAASDWPNMRFQQI